MIGKPEPRPAKLIDALDARERKPLVSRVWRVVREDYDVLRAARSGGRWDDETFDVLYTSLSKEGAVAERIFHLAKGQPVIPSIPKYVVHEIDVALSAVLDLSDTEVLRSLGLDMSKFGALSYARRVEEYPSTQQIGEIANFLEFDGILVPSARSQSTNLVIFVERVKPDQIVVPGAPEKIDIQKVVRLKDTVRGDPAKPRKIRGLPLSR